MNKRKAKKRRKQQEHELQICVEAISRLPELVGNVLREIMDYIKQFCQKLDPQQIALARSIRMKGRDANEQEKSST